MRYTLRSIFSGLFLSLLSILVMILLGDISNIGARLAGYQWSYFVIAVILYFFTHLLRFLKFNLLLNNAGIRRLPLERRIDLYVSCSPLNATNSRVSDSYQALNISRSSGIPLAHADGITFINRITEIPAMVALVAAGSITYPSFLPFFLGILIVFLVASVNLKLFSYLPPAPILGSRKSKLRTVWQNLSWLSKEQPDSYSGWKTLLVCVFQILDWLTQAGILFIILQGFGYSATPALFATSCLVIGFTMFAATLSNLPGGVIVVELSMAALLTVLLNFQPALAVLTTLLYRAATFWIGFLFGILVWPEAVKTTRQEPGAIRIVKG
jgi:uncharacterized protein (TIRG00374 family)